MIKLIVSDLDGTLFDETHSLNEKTAKAIHEAQANGIEFMVATGRGKENVLPYFDGAGITCAKIVLNGAMFLNEHNEVEISVPMDYEDVRMIYHLMEEHDVITHIFYENGVACTDPDQMKNEFIRRFMDKEQMRIEEVEKMIDEAGFCRFDKKIDDIESFLEEQPSIYKMEAFANDEDAIQNIRQKLMMLNHLEVSNSVGDNIEVTDVRAQKGIMLEEVCKRKGLAFDEVITIGDSMNDLSMLRDFPNSYAMGNACDEIKKAARYETATNTEYGVVKVIASILDKQKQVKR